MAKITHKEVKKFAMSIKYGSYPRCPFTIFAITAVAETREYCGHISAAETVKIFLNGLCDCVSRSINVTVCLGHSSC